MFKWKKKNNYITKWLFFSLYIVHVENEYCRPRPTLVAIDNPSYKFFPYFINLHRCGGSCDKIQPSVLSCVPTRSTEVPVTVQVVGTKRWTKISMQNHTSCGCECTLSPSQCDPIWENWKPDLCQCRCKYGDKPPKPCGNGLVWSKNDCRCVCNKEPEICPPNKVWSLCNLRQRRLSYLRSRYDSQRRFLAEHSVATLLRHCFGWLQHWSNIAALCCAKIVVANRLV